MKQTKRMRMNNKKRTRRQRGGEWSFPWFGSKTQQDDVPVKEQQEQVKPQGMFSFLKLPEFLSNQTQSAENNTSQPTNNTGGKKSKRRRYKNKH